MYPHHPYYMQTKRRSIQKDVPSEETYNEEYYRHMFPTNADKAVQVKHHHKKHHHQNQVPVVEENLEIPTSENVVVIWRRQDLAQKSAKSKDAYDLDDNTASPYDDSTNINGGKNVYFKHLRADEPVGMSVADDAKKIKKEIEDKEAKEEAKKSGVPAEPKAEVNEAAKGDAEAAMAAAAPAKEDAAKAVAEEVAPAAEAALMLKKNITGNVTAFKFANLTSNSTLNLTKNAT